MQGGGRRGLEKGQSQGEAAVLAGKEGSWPGSTTAWTLAFPWPGQEGERPRRWAVGGMPPAAFILPERGSCSPSRALSGLFKLALVPGLPKSLPNSGAEAGAIQDVFCRVCCVKVPMRGRALGR